jgi:hypothetical protein
MRERGVLFRVFSFYGKVLAGMRGQKGIGRSGDQIAGYQGTRVWGDEIPPLAAPLRVELGRDDRPASQKDGGRADDLCLGIAGAGRGKSAKR